MLKKTYALIANIEKRHWWYRARHEIIETLIKEFLTAPLARIINVGCGTGSTMSIWKRLAREVIGIDTAGEALLYAQSQGFERLNIDDAQTLSTIESESADMVVALDVFEHLPDDRAAMVSANRVLRPGGLLLVTVPAKMYLWGGADIMSEHCRRYEKKAIAILLEENNFSMLRITYFNTFLFIPIFLARKLEKVFTINPEREYAVPHRVLNRILYKIFRSEKFFLRYVNFPIGVSIAVIARKQPGNGARGL